MLKYLFVKKNVANFGTNNNNNNLIFFELRRNSYFQLQPWLCR